MGAGKSTVSEKLQKLGAVLIDADQLAREALALDGEAYRATIELFGETILASDRSIDRAKLAELVFTDERSRLALEALIHPIVARRRAQIVDACAPGDLIVEDIPLLVEKNLAGGYDRVIVVHAPEKVRMTRLIKTRGLSSTQVQGRFAAQASEVERMAVADFVVDNSGDEASLDAQVGVIWQRLRQLSHQ